MKFVRKWFIGILLFISVFPISAQELIVDYLSNVRDEIVFPEMDNTEKRIIAEQSQILLRDLYVHRYQKESYYGSGFSFGYNQHIDPVPAIEKIVEDIDNITVKEMEESIYKIFVNQRDLHLNYIFPAPYNRYRTFLPLTFTRVADGWELFQVRINSTNIDQFNQYIPDQRIPEVGDIVVAYDNLPMLAAIERQKGTAQGANFYGGFTRALGQMTMIPHIVHLVPEINEVDITLKSAATGEIYSITLPWLTQWREEVRNSMMMKTSPDKKKFKNTPEDFTQGIDLWQIEYNKFIKENKLEPASIYPSIPSNEPVISWGIIEKDSKDYGYLKISSFSPANGTNFAIDEIIRLIYEEFDETEGLIIDVRNNGGGSITFADKLSQLFMPKNADAIKARLLNTDLNRDIFNNSLFGLFFPAWKEAINEVEGTDELYTDLVAFTDSSEANEIGQVYYKNVAVLTNARSYSATDIFACAMQDNGAAIILGEDPKTGAGGANVMEQADFARLVGSPFTTLPLDHRMRVSWRQSIRFGSNEGLPIEDYGCSADMDVSLSPSDIIDGGDDQLDKIICYLTLTSDIFESYVKLEQNNRELFLSQDDSKFDVTVANTDYIKIYIDDVLYREMAVYAHFVEKNIEIELPSDLPTGEIINVKLVGSGWFDEQKWNVKRKVIILDEKIILDDNGFEMDFSLIDDLGPLMVLNNGNEPGDGWNFVRPYLQVGFNPEYKDNVETNAVLFLDLSNRTSVELSFTLEAITEYDFDFIEISVTDNNNKNVLFFDSGDIPLDTYNINISEFAGMDNIALHFRFISDGGVTAPGAKISSISIK